MEVTSKGMKEERQRIKNHRITASQNHKMKLRVTKSHRIASRIEIGNREKCHGNGEPTTFLVSQPTGRQAGKQASRQTGIAAVVVDGPD